MCRTSLSVLLSVWQRSCWGKRGNVILSCYQSINANWKEPSSAHGLLCLTGADVIDKETRENGKVKRCGTDRHRFLEELMSIFVRLKIGVHSGRPLKYSNEEFSSILFQPKNTNSNKLPFSTSFQILLIKTNGIPAGDKVRLSKCEKHY